MIEILSKLELHLNIRGYLENHKVFLKKRKKIYKTSFLQLVYRTALIFSE